MLIFYGFCIPDNKHDSVLIRINKKLSDEDRFSIDSIVQALVVPNDKIEQGFQKDFELNKLETTDKTSLFSNKTITVELKAKALNKNLLSYLRAHCLMFYNGKDIASLRVTEPTDINYELMILNTYEKVLNQFKEIN